MWRLLLAGLLALPAVAEARMKAGPVVMSPHVRAWVGSGSGAAQPPPLDSLTSAIAAFGFRKLSTSYAGQAIRLRRASDNAQQDIGFVGNDFDTPTAATFCNATSCYAAKWYDQSGNPRDILNVTNTASFQPLLIFNCVGGQVCLSFTSATVNLAAAAYVPTGPISISTVSARPAGTVSCYFSTNGAAGNRIQFRNGSQGYTLSGASGSINTAGDTAWHATSAVINGASSFITLDSTVTTGAVTVSTTSAQTSITGTTSTTCNYTEAITWDNFAMSQGQATALADSQKAYWGF